MGYDFRNLSPTGLVKSVKNTLWGSVGQNSSPKPPGSCAIPLKTDTMEPVISNVVGNGFVKLAGLSGAIAVVMGAYGAHVFLKRKDIPDELKDVYRTGNLYHFLHSLALLAMPVVKRPMLVGSLLTSGMIIFCGTCYIYSMTGDKGIGRAAPYGGTLLILGWLSMLI